MYGFVSFRLILLFLSAACFYIWIPRAALLCPPLPCHAMPCHVPMPPSARRRPAGLRTLPHVPPRLIGYLCVFIFIFGFYPVSHAIWIYDVCIMICTCVCGSAALGIGNSSIIEESVYLFPPFFNFSSSASYSTTCVLPTYPIT